MHETGVFRFAEAAGRCLHDGASLLRSVYIHEVVLSAEVNYARGMWACRFASTRASSALRYNFVLIDVEVEVLLTSTKAKVRLYQKHVSVLGGVYTKTLHAKTD